MLALAIYQNEKPEKVLSNILYYKYKDYADSNEHIKSLFLYTSFLVNNDFRLHDDLFVLIENSEDDLYAKRVDGNDFLELYLSGNLNSSDSPIDTTKLLVLAHV